MPVCVAGAALCLCACFYGLAGAGCLLCVVSLCALVCGCLRLSVCLWCAVGVCVAGFALCAAVGVCAVVCALMLRCSAVGVLFSIKTRVYSDFRMKWIICGLSIDYVPIILYIISPPALEIIEIMLMCFLGQKRGTPTNLEVPPLKILPTLYFYGNRKRYKVESISA